MILHSKAAAHGSLTICGARVLDPGAGVDALLDVKIEKGKIDGDKVSFEINMEFGPMAYAGTVSGDEMKLSISVNGDATPVVLKRVK